VQSPPLPGSCNYAREFHGSRAQLGTGRVKAEG